MKNLIRNFIGDEDRSGIREMKSIIYKNVR